ncbi:hypothetical protein NDU88_011165 [Pleurodeles waltl]|uniref:Uncharacterized protein n=1 Tax=Pleurodeles waltl TaxID=8319 RepID=A0AAV7Q036_PLEWA|nr:hypothetical protein NDU88_011165 [Pleurodeles waltl]
MEGCVSPRIHTVMRFKFFLDHNLPNIPRGPWKVEKKSTTQDTSNGEQGTPHRKKEKAPKPLTRQEQNTGTEAKKKPAKSFRQQTEPEELHTLARPGVSSTKQESHSEKRRQVRHPRRQSVV